MDGDFGDGSGGAEDVDTGGEGGGVDRGGRLFKEDAGGRIERIMACMGVCIGWGEVEGGAVAGEGYGEGEAVGNAVM